MMSPAHRNSGSSSNLTYDANSVHHHCPPCLYQGLRNEKLMDFKDFCRIILRFEYNQQENTMAEELSSLLDRYRLPVAEETDRYEPFIQLANEILEDCGSDYIFVRNDPKYLWGIESLCKPDILLVHKSAWLLRSVEGPEVPFHPCDIISFHEFKLVQKDLGVSSTPRSTSCELWRIYHFF